MIKKVSFFILLSLILSGCTNTPIEKEEKINFLKDSPLLFSEFYKGLSAFDRAVELYNVSNESIDLSEYSIKVYRPLTNEIHSTIELNGSLSGHSTFVIVDSKADEQIIEKADLVVEELHIDGSWPISINKGEKICDVMGQIGYQTDYAKYSDLVRKNEFFIGRESIDKYDWIRYQPNDITHLGTIEDTMSELELLGGPKLTDASFSKEFVLPNGECGGGAVKVSLQYVGDGDTTTFNFPSSVIDEYVHSRESVRYLSINTPEIQHGDSIDAQPWGYEAKRYNNEVLNNAKHYVIQTSEGASLRDTYGRMLAYVWYTNKENPSPSDYVCLNFEMVIKGLAFTYFTADNNRIDPMTYKQVSYVDILKNGELYAKRLGIKIHGEVDPSFNY